MSESGEKKLSISWYGERKVKYVWKSECWRDTNCVGKRLEINPNQRLHTHLHVLVDLNGRRMNISPNTSSNKLFILLNDQGYFTYEKEERDVSHMHRQLDLQKHNTDSNVFPHITNALNNTINEREGKKEEVNCWFVELLLSVLIPIPI